MRVATKTTRIASLVVACLALGALGPAAAFAADTEITSSKMTLPAGIDPGSGTGWAYYCPSSYPYLKVDKTWDGWTPRYRNLSSSGVSVANNFLHTRMSEGKLAITYTNWNFFSSATAQIAYTCSTEPAWPLPAGTGS